MKGYLVVFFCGILLAACQGKPAQASEREALESQVMAVHDAAMGRISQIFLLRRNLSQARNSLLSQQADTTGQHQVHLHLAALQKADAAMMEWMHQYKSPAKDQGHAEAMDYLQLQLQKIKQVQKQIDSSLAAAQIYYDQHEQRK